MSLLAVGSREAQALGAAEILHVPGEASLAQGLEVLTVSGYLTPSTLYFGTTGGKPAEKLRTTPSFFNANRLEVTRHEAGSKDGTKVPYFQVSRKDLKRDGSNPTLLYGYGGFEVSMTPAYRPVTGAAWLEKGGVYVVANGAVFPADKVQKNLELNRFEPL